MPKFEVWSTGFLIQGMDKPEPASLMGTADAETFEEACRIVCSKPPHEEGLLEFDRKNGVWTYWGCQLYPDEASARNTKFG